MTESPPRGPAARPPLLIVGASARAAAFSALRAGFDPVCLDYYADADLAAVSRVRRVEGAQGLLDAISEVPSVPALYTGAIENEPAILDALAARGPLWGNPRSIVEQVRNPRVLAEAFDQLRLPRLDVRSADQPPPRDGTWLIKPLRSGGGRQIAPWEAGTATLPEPHYFQQRAAGDAFSAVFVAPPDRSDVRFVGLTRQVVGDPQLAAAPFGWCGSVGPETLAVGTEHLMRRIGNYLSWKFGLCGLFGCDFLVDAEGTPWMTEVNPRYPASAEVLEHVLHIALMRDHCAAFGAELPEPRAAGAGPLHACGKFVLFSDRDFTAPAPEEWLQPDEWLHADLWSHPPRLSDVPPAGTAIWRGAPICTLFTRGETAADCLGQLPNLVASVRARLAG
jgi:predicted ATP-grasp superfamily ATP-dependent carboligase